MLSVHGVSLADSALQKCKSVYFTTTACQFRRRTHINVPFLNNIMLLCYYTNYYIITSRLVISINFNAINKTLT